MSKVRQDLKDLKKKLSGQSRMRTGVNVADRASAHIPAQESKWSFLLQVRLSCAVLLLYLLQPGHRRARADHSLTAGAARQERQRYKSRAHPGRIALAVEREEGKRARCGAHAVMAIPRSGRIIVFRPIALENTASGRGKQYQQDHMLRISQAQVQRGKQISLGIGQGQPQA
jgi:hypothetical protein